jgi:lipopolysaccharide export system permease protein
MWWNRFILERYLLGQMLMPVLAGVGGGTLLLTAGKLFQLADRLVEDRVPPLDVLKLLLLDIPATMVLAMPIAAMFATMLTMGKLSGNSELTALRAVGVPFRRLFAPILLMGLVLSLVSFGISNGMVPPSRQQIREIDQRSIVAQAQQEQNQDVFFKTEDNLWFFIHSVNPKLNTMEEVTILDVLPAAPGEPQLLKQVILAGQASWDGEAWMLMEGIVHSYAPDGTSIGEAPFERRRLDVSDDLATLMLPPVAPDQLSLPDLHLRIQNLSRSNVSTEDLQTEWHSRFSIPLASFFAVLISLPLATHTARQVGRYGGVVFGILLVFVYYVILNVARSLGEAGAVEPWLAAWSHNILFGGVGVLLLVRFMR